MKRIACLLITVLLLCLVSTAGTASTGGKLDIMPLSMVKPGQKGTGLTVISGTTIEAFDVEVLDCMITESPTRSLILVRVSGPPIERSGGIAAGMSGSPVYIDGRLVGAIAYGFDNADHTLGLLTPAEDMLAVQKLLPSVPSLSVEEVAAGGHHFTVGAAGEEAGLSFDHVVLAPNQLSAAMYRNNLPDGTVVAYPVATPVMVQGFGARSRQLLDKAMSRWNLLSIPAGQAWAGNGEVELVPGAAIGVQLIRGDVNYTAIGTLTFLTDGGFSAFGHPFLHRGQVDFFATGAYIHQTVKSSQVPFKLGSPLSPIGRLLQDRSAAIAGVIGDLPDGIDLSVHVTDKSTGRQSSFRAEVVRDEMLSPALLAIAMLEALDRGIDRIGRGTAEVITRVRADELSQQVSRHNMFYSSSDISAALLGEFLRNLQALMVNDVSAVTLQAVSLEVQIDEERQTARIEKVVPSTYKVRPGETVEVTVHLKPYRGETSLVIMNLMIPEDIRPGEAAVNVRGGGYGLPRLAVSDVVLEITDGDEEEEVPETEKIATAENLDNLVNQLFEREKNYEVVLELFSVGEMDMMVEREQEGVFGEGGTSPLDPIKVKLSTDWVIQGDAYFQLEILPAEQDRGPEDGSGAGTKETMTGGNEVD
ncbi:MAG TPA: hypothetical protein GXX29_06660 [Firmicutes bacterium]|nr:hypothetical protein [Bacillota bacterium]